MAVPAAMMSIVSLPSVRAFYHDLGIIAIGQVFRWINAFTQRIDDECTVADTFWKPATGLLPLPSKGEISL